MKRWHRRAGLAVVAALSVGAVALVPSAFGGAATPRPWERPATNEEYSMLALANRDRSQPDRGERVAPPMIWNDNLALAARYHTWDTMTHGCATHDSCNGESWVTRVRRFYGPGAYALGENMTFGDAAQAHRDWMQSPGHRANILSANYAEFGGGIMTGPPERGYMNHATGDFGTRGPVTIPPIPAAGVLLPDNTGQATQPWRWPLLVNYYDQNGRTPTVVRAFIDGVAQNLSRSHGTSTHGTWSGFAIVGGWNDPAFCKKVHFEVVRSDGNTFRWPAAGREIGLGFAPGCWNVWQSGGGTNPTSTTTTTRPPSGSAPVVTVDTSRVSNTVVIRATAADDTKVVRIEVYGDGQRLIRRAAATVTRRWTLKPGSHTITVKAYDDAGNVGTKSVTVTR